MDGGTISFYKNDVLQGSYSGLTGTQFALWEAFTPTGIGTANFGATPFAYSVPSGYNSGLYA